LLGEGILKGLGETARNFVGSFVSAERLTTVQYPEERIAPIEATRDFPFLVYDGTDWEAGLRCVACQICEKECPPKCIYIAGQAADLSCALRHRYFGLHELPDLRGSLPV
jgi:NADH-quinone oxidoreductase subunit I